MKYDVHLYAVVRVKVTGIEAESQADAISKSQQGFDLDDLLGGEFHTHLQDGRVLEHAEYADEITSYVVDEVGDEQYQRSRFYHFDDDKKLVEDHA